MRRLLLPLLASATFLALAGGAAGKPVLLAIGTLDGSSAGPGLDLSGLKGKLENGLPQAMLGGIGSGLASAGGDDFLAVPDRGPNGPAYDPKIDDTVSYIPRFDEIALKLAKAAAGAKLPFTVTPKLTKTTLLWNQMPLVYGTGAGLGVGPGAPAGNTESRFYFTGRADGFNPAKSSCDPSDARLDPESVRVSPDGATVYVSDEYGPHLYAFDRKTGKRLQVFALPKALCAASPAATKRAELAGNRTGRTPNKGMEGIALTPDGSRILGMMQAPTLQDAGNKATKKVVDLVSVQLASGDTQTFAYKLTKGMAVSDIVAVNDYAYLVDERGPGGLGAKSKARVKDVYRIDISGAQNVTGLKGKARAQAAVKKTLLFNLVDLLGRNGIPASKVPAKIEGMAFGKDVKLKGKLLHTLVIASDNDFQPASAGPTTFYVIGLSATDLPGYFAETFGP